MDYVMVRPSHGSTLAFLLVIVIVALAFPAAVWLETRVAGVAAARRAALRACGATLVVLAASALLAESGALAILPSGVGVMLYVLICSAGAAAVAFSGVGGRMAQNLPLHALVGFQAFRLPLELILHRWYLEGVIPVQMTYEGRNLDVITGILALLAWPLLYLGKLGRRSVWLFNLAGVALLLNVMIIAVRSSPVPLRAYWNEPPVLLALHAPYTWIAPVCVGGALLGHLITFRRLVGSEQPVTRPRGSSA